ncbi:hypothetical protein L596_017838 [Steinernema carpocapsae]|uniref:Uncharacterized protein n=1 Tax=Steinernema carpocapsae TaxID=34508 RepID=A0A4U5N352_STECR|nr:hypothetical protein L596_017838 [Steinernema carpocapsae]
MLDNSRVFFLLHNFYQQQCRVVDENERFSQEEMDAYCNILEQISNLQLQDDENSGHELQDNVCEPPNHAYTDDGLGKELNGGQQSGFEGFYPGYTPESHGNVYNPWSHCYAPATHGYASQDLCKPWAFCYTPQSYGYPYEGPPGYGYVFPNPGYAYQNVHNPLGYGYVPVNSGHASQNLYNLGAPCYTPQSYGYTYQDACNPSPPKIQGYGPASYGYTYEAPSDYCYVPVDYGYTLQGPC